MDFPQYAWQKFSLPSLTEEQETAEAHEAVVSLFSSHFYKSLLIKKQKKMTFLNQGVQQQGAMFSKFRNLLEIK